MTFLIPPHFRFRRQGSGLAAIRMWLLALQSFWSESHMHPSRSSSPDRNPFSHNAFAVASDNPASAAEDANPTHAANPLYQQNALGELPTRRSSNAQRLNTIAHTIGPYLDQAIEIVRANPAEATTSTAPPISIDSIRQYLRDNGHHGSNLVNATIESRLMSIRLTKETLFAALQIIHTPNHPLWTSLQTTHPERKAVISRLSGIVLYASGCDPAMRASILQANNDPYLLICSMLDLYRREHPR